jgi:hypothetical protein
MGAAIVTVAAYWTRTAMQVIALRRLGVRALVPKRADFAVLRDRIRH